MRLISDGIWHTVEELAGELGWTEARTRATLELLAESGLVSFAPSVQSARIDAELRSLMLES